MFSPAKIHTLQIVAALAAVLALSGRPAQAQLVTETDTPEAAAVSFPYPLYTAALNTTNDLLNGASPFLYSTALQIGNEQEGGGGIAPLTNGLYYPVGSNASHAGLTVAPSGSDAYYNLGNAALGYSLNSIQVYSGWNDSGRVDQSYTILYSTVSAPSTFVPLATVNYAPSSYYALETELTPTLGSTLATGVADVEIEFNKQQNGYVGYDEFIVNGAPVVAPEPSSWALTMLGGLGLCGLGARARRRAA